MKLKLISICLMACIFFSKNAIGQYNDFNDLGGNLYYITLPQVAKGETDERHPDNRVNEVYFYIFSDTSQTIQITDLRGNVMLMKVKKDSIGIYKAYSSTTLYNNLAIPINNILGSFKIKSDFPIVVYCYMNTSAGAEAWTPIPADAWGTDYFAATLKGDFIYNVVGDDEVSSRFTKQVTLAYPEVIVTALEDNTKYTITNPDLYKQNKLTDLISGKNIAANGILNSGESLYLRGYIDSARIVNSLSIPNELELAGLNISSNKPIGVISGNQRFTGGGNFRNLTGFAKNFYKNLLIEAVAPTIYHGKTFVIPPPSYADYEAGYVRVYGTNGDTTKLGNAAGFYKIPKGGVSKTDTLPSVGCMLLPKTDLNNASYFVTDRPSQAFYNTISKGIPSKGTDLKQYFGYGPFMVEIIPEENWSGSTPIFTGSGLQAHYLNIVTDSTHKSDIFLNKFGTKEEVNLICDYKVKGTKFVCGGFQIEPNLSGVIYCKNGGKLCGYVYGIGQGNEQFMPGKNLLNKNEEVLEPHPADHKEENSRCYAYPLASKRIQRKDYDSLKIDSSKICSVLYYKITWVNGSPNAIRSVQLYNGLNTAIKYINPKTRNGVFTANVAEFEVYAIDPNKNASAVVIINDRNGLRKSINYYWQGMGTLNTYFEPSVVRLLCRVKGEQSTTEILTFVNRTNRKLVVNSLSTANPKNFYIDAAVTPKFPITLKPLDTLKIGIYAVLNATFKDSLKVNFDCSTLYIPIVIDNINPCIYVNDLDFGTLRVGQNATLPLKIENRQGGELKFKSSDKTGYDVLTWLDSNFDVPKSEILKLSKTVLRKNEYIYINVTFNAKAVGKYFTKGIFYTNTNCTKDTSYWYANVIAPGPSISGYNWGEKWLTTNNKCTKNTKSQYSYDSIKVLNSGSAPAIVKEISLFGVDADLGYFQLADNPKVNKDFVLSTTPAYQGVLFFPDTVREYSCKIQLVTTDLDTVWGELRGIGVETGLTISGFNFGTKEFLGYRKTVFDGKIRVSNNQTFPLNIINLSIFNDSLDEFSFEDPTELPTRLNKLVLLQNEFREYNVKFEPKTEGARKANIRASGNHPFCNDSTNVLLGNTFIDEPIEIEGQNFDEISFCEESDGLIMVKNPTNKVVVIDKIIQTPADSAFIINESLPISVQPNSNYGVKIKFRPKKHGYFSTDLYFVIDSNKLFNTRITANAFSVGSELQMKENFDLEENAEIELPVNLNSTLEKGKINELGIKLIYSKESLKMLNAGDFNNLFFRTPFEDWQKIIIDSSAGLFFIKLKAPEGIVLEKYGNIINPRFFAAATDTNRFRIQVQMLFEEKKCVEVNSAVSVGMIKKICNSSLRQIELSGTKSYLKQNYPNPFSPQTQIEFGMALEGRARIDIYDNYGKKILTLFEANIKPGNYQLSWDATNFESGVYYCRFNYGYGAKICTMILKK